MNQNTHELKNERFLISTRQNNVKIFGIRRLYQSDKQISNTKRKKNLAESHC